jgi:dehydrogenase/reductase SDR family member 7B
MRKVLHGKVVIITGASSGIGRALAIEAARRKAKVVVAARRIEMLQSVAEEIASLGAEFLIVETDVAIAAECEKLINRTVEKFGRIDVLINNAGISMRALFKQTQPEVLERIINVNFWGTVHCTRYALPWLLQSKGTLVGISSVAGFKGLPGRTGYSASKFAIQGFLEALRIEHRKDNLGVLIVSPGFTSTEIRFKALNKDGDPQGSSPRNEKRMMLPDHVALRTMDAIQNKRRLLILSLEGKIIIAIQRFFPTFLDRIVYNQMAKEPDSPFK